jgi:hypothetical protein
MKIEEIIRTTTILNNSKRIILNVLYAQNIINEIQWSFETVCNSGEQFNVLRILRGQKEIQLIWVSFRANDSQNEQHH